VVLCPSNPITSIGPILAVSGVREALVARRETVVGISPIIGDSALLPLANHLMPTAGLPVSAEGAARAYRGLLGTWIIDTQDSHHAGAIEVSCGIDVVVAPTVMVDDDAARLLARRALATAHA
jgi:LPPG:FO 2-phospho-L-lactate transferase